MGPGSSEGVLAPAIQLDNLVKWPIGATSLIHKYLCMYISFFCIYIVLRAVHLWSVVLQCSSKSCLKANLSIRITYFWARLLIIAYPLSKLFGRKGKR